MALPKLLCVHDEDRRVGFSNTPMEVWINTEDISMITLTDPRTPTVDIYLRSDTRNNQRAPIRVQGAEAKAMIASLRRTK